MEHQADVSPEQTPKRLVAALLVYWLFAGIFCASRLSSPGGDSSEMIALYVVGLIAVPIAVLFALRTAKYRSWKPAVRVIAVLAVAGMIASVFTDVTTWPAFAIVCVSFPAGAFAGVWLDPPRPNPKTARSSL